MKHAIAPVLAAVMVGGAGLGAAAARAAPADDTIVRISGDQENGFTVRHYDGSVDHLPTDSEARAECREYDTRLDRVRCRVETRVWYRDLGQTKKAIAYARSAS